jgi:hypothetical protein
VLNVEIEVNLLELERNNQEIESEEDIIVINTSLIVPLTRGKGQSRKNLNVIVFLQDNV